MARKLLPEDEKLQREIARRLKRGVPLAGLVSAALLCGGCGGETPPHVVGKMPASERRNVPEKCTPPSPGEEKKPPAPPRSSDNSRREQQPRPPRLAGEPPRPNRK